MAILSSIFEWLVTMGGSIVAVLIKIVGAIFLMFVFGMLALDDAADRPTFKSKTHYEAYFIDRLSNTYGLNIPEGAEILDSSYYYEATIHGEEDFKYNLILNSKGFAKEDFVPEGVPLRFGVPRRLTLNTSNIQDSKIKDSELSKIIWSLESNSVELNYATKNLELKDNPYEKRGRVVVAFIPDSNFVWIQEVCIC